MSALDEVGRGLPALPGLDDILDVGTEPDHYAPDLGKFGTCLMMEAGGPAGLAKTLWAEFESAPTGGSTRAGILRLMVEVLKLESAKEGGRRDALSDLSPAQLKAAAVHLRLVAGE